MSTSTAWAPQSQIETDESAGRALNGKVKETSIVAALPRMCKAEVFECICVFVCLRVCSPKAICKAPALNVVT